jgi:hypothetical protein
MALSTTIAIDCGGEDGGDAHSRGYLTPQGEATMRNQVRQLACLEEVGEGGAVLGGAEQARKGGRVALPGG